MQEYTVGIPHNNVHTYVLVNIEGGGHFDEVILVLEVPRETKLSSGVYYKFTAFLRTKGSTAFELL